MKLPDYVLTALELLEKNGYEAVVVGGAVRDFLLKQKPNDYDISTNALPDEVKKVFEKYFSVDTGTKHGTVTIFINHHQIEVTTYRTEKDYEDFRHPKKVEFVNNLESDLLRRDFTINAICFNKNKDIIDLVAGIDDLNKCLIRAIGDPKERFYEDPLRILRALRFSATLGFTIEKRTKEAIYEYVSLIDKVSKERINVEFSKLILGKNAANVLFEYLDIITYFIPEINKDNFNNSIYALNFVRDDLTIKLATLFYTINKEDLLKMMKRLKYSNNMIKNICYIVDKKEIDIEIEEQKVIKMLNLYSYQDLLNFIEVKIAYCKVQDFKDDIIKLNEFKKIIEKVHQERDCFRIKDLKVSGRDLINIGYKEGIGIRIALEKILEEVMEGRLKNSWEDLIDYARNLLEKPKN